MNDNVKIKIEIELPRKTYNFIKSLATIGGTDLQEYFKYTLIDAIRADLEETCSGPFINEKELKHHINVLENILKNMSF